MNNEPLKLYSFDEIKDEMIGKVGTPERDQYEYELKMDILSDMIRQVRKERNLTQEELGQLVGVQKAQISKLEKSAKNVTLDTILKVFTALKARINFKVELLDRELQIS